MACLPVFTRKTERDQEGGAQTRGEHLGCQNSHGSQCEHYPYARSRSPRLYVLGTNAHAPRPRAANQHESDFTCHHERNDNVALLGGVQCQPQPGTYFVRIGFQFSRSGSQPTSLSVTVPARCRAGDAWWFGCALQDLFQCGVRRRQYFFGLLYRQHCHIASLTRGSVTECTGDFSIVMG